jgi:hypothetical protein
MEVSDKLYTPVLYTQEGASDTNRMGGWVGPKDILGIRRDKFLTPAKNFTVSQTSSYYQLLESLR